MQDNFSIPKNIWVFLCLDPNDYPNSRQFLAKEFGDRKFHLIAPPSLSDETIAFFKDEKIAIDKDAFGQPLKLLKAILKLRQYEVEELFIRYVTLKLLFAVFLIKPKATRVIWQNKNFLTLGEGIFARLYEVFWLRSFGILIENFYKPYIRTPLIHLFWGTYSYLRPRWEALLVFLYHAVWERITRFIRESIVSLRVLINKLLNYLTVYHRIKEKVRVSKNYFFWLAGNALERGLRFFFKRSLRISLTLFLFPFAMLFLFLTTWWLVIKRKFGNLLQKL